MSAVTSAGNSTLTRRRCNRDPGAVGDAEPRRVVGIDLHRAALLALHQNLDVVQPRVGRSQLAAPDQQEFFVRGPTDLLRAAGKVGGDLIGDELDLAGGRDENLAQSGHQRPEVDPVWICLELSEAEAVGVGPEAVTPMAEAEHEVEELLGPGPVAEQFQDLGWITAGHDRLRI